MEADREPGKGTPETFAIGEPSEPQVFSVTGTAPDFIKELAELAAENPGALTEEQLWEAAERLDDLATLKDAEIIHDGLTYSDVLIQVEHSDIRREKKLDYEMRLTKQIKLNLPLLSAAMNKVTESDMAIAMAREGGAGVIHKNLSAEAQAAEIETVKRASSAFISEPRSLGPDATVADFLEIKAQNIGSVMITDTGEPDGKLMGMVTKRQLRGLLIEQINNRHDDTDTLDLPPNVPLREVMYTFEPHELLRSGSTQQDAMAQFAESENENIDRLPVVGVDGNLEGLFTFKDIHELAKYPMAAKDEKGRLIVGAAIGVGETSLQHVDVLVKKEVDFVVVDAAHGFDQAVIDLVRDIKQHHPELQVIAGNVATARATRALIEAGADAIKVGIGPGSICTTREVVGVGEAQVAALRLAALAAGRRMPIIADGGIEQFGDINKAFVADADIVMMGSKFAGHDESPGEIVTVAGQKMMKIAGMGAVESIKEAEEAKAEGRYFQVGTDEYEIVPEGGTGFVPYKGELHRTIIQMKGSLTKLMYYTGRKHLRDVHTCRFVRRSPGAVAESGMHGIKVEEEPTNYRHS